MLDTFLSSYNVLTANALELFNNFISLTAYLRETEYCYCYDINHELRN